MALSFSACGGSSDEEIPAVSTDSGAISVTPLDMMQEDLGDGSAYTKTTIGGQEYLSHEANSTSMYYYTVINSE